MHLNKFYKNYKLGNGEKLVSSKEVYMEEQKKNNVNFDLEAKSLDVEQFEDRNNLELPTDCFGTFGTAGTIGGCAGTAGTFGCCG